MKKLSLFIASLFINKDLPLTDPSVRARYGMLEGWISIVGNLFLFGIKLFLGLQVKSAALIADAIHTLADSATSVVVIIGFKAAQKEPDEEHPFGHGRMEPVVTLIISVLLFVAGAELLQHSIRCIINPIAAHASNTAILIISATIVAKELMARFSFIIGDYIDSDALKADALHHRSDVFATALVVVALVASRFGWTMTDGIMGCMVSLVIFYSAYSIARDAINPLLGEPPSREFLDQVESLCNSKPGVLGVHDIISHRYGQTSVTSLHIEVSHLETALNLHRIAEEVEEEISAMTHGMVVVHIDPVNRDHPEYKTISDLIRKIIDENEKTESFHDLRIVGEDTSRCTILFDITTTQNTPENEHRQAIDEIKEKLQDVFPRIKVAIKAAPKYSFKP